MTQDTYPQMDILHMLIATWNQAVDFYRLERLPQATTWVTLAMRFLAHQDDDLRSTYEGQIREHADEIFAAV